MCSHSFLCYIEYRGSGALAREGGAISPAWWGYFSVHAGLSTRYMHGWKMKWMKILQSSQSKPATITRHGYTTMQKRSSTVMNPQNQKKKLPSKRWNDSGMRATPQRRTNSANAGGMVSGSCRMMRRLNYGSAVQQKLGMISLSTPWQSCCTVKSESRRQ